MLVRSHKVVIVANCLNQGSNEVRDEGGSWTNITGIWSWSP